MFTVRRFRVFAGARRAIAAVAASAIISPCGVGILSSEAPDGDRSSAGRPIATESAVPGCPQPRCWWIPTPAPRPPER